MAVAGLLLLCDLYFFASCVSVTIKRRRMGIHYIQSVVCVSVPLKRKRVVIHYIQSVARVDIKEATWKGYI